MQDIGSIVNLGIIAAAGVLFLFGFLRGLRKGLWKSLADIGFVIVCLFISILVSKGITNTLIDVEKMGEILVSLKGSVSGDMASTIDSFIGYIDQVKDNPGAVSAILAIPAALITPIIFIVVHILLGIIIKIPKLIIERVLFGRNGGPEYRGGNRLLGGLFGGVRNALFIIILIVPILGFVGLADDVLGTIESVEITESAGSVSDTDGESQAASPLNSGSSSGIAEIRSEFITPIVKAPAVKIIRSAGGDAIFNSLTTKKVDDAKISLRVEADCFAKLYANASVFMGSDPAEYGDAQKSAIENIKAILHEAELVPYVVSEVLSFAADSWLNGEDVFGVEKINVGSDYQDAFDNLLLTLSTTDINNIRTDFDTVANIIEICIDNDFFKEMFTEEGSIMTVIENEQFLIDVFSEIYENERTRPAIGFISNTVVELIYDIYDEINNTTTQKPSKLDVSTLTATDIENEAKLISEVVVSLNVFLESIENLDDSDENALIKNANLAVLGAALDKLKSSILLGKASNFLIVAMLKSEAVAEMGFVNQSFIDQISKEGTSLENTLASAQKLAIMALSLGGSGGITEDNYDDAIKFMITEMTPETAETIKSVLTDDVLSGFGMSTEESNTISNTINSVIDGMVGISAGDLTEEEIEKEVEAVNTLVGIMKDASSSLTGGSTEDLFGSSEDSVTGVTPDELIDTVISSQIVSDAINNASKNEDDEVVEDPFGVAGSLSDGDKAAAEDAIKNYFDDNSTGDTESDEELKNTLGSIANILGMNASDWFNR